MNTSSCNFECYVLLTPKLQIVGKDPVCSLSIGIKDDPIAQENDSDHWIHTMIRLHGATASYACSNLKKGDRIFIANARYHVDETENIKGDVKQTHYFARGSITKLLSAEDVATLNTHKADDDGAPMTGKTGGEAEMSINEWEAFLEKEPTEPTVPTIDEECPF